MDTIRIRGGASLAGTIPIAGAKNAALPLMAASLLTDRTLHLVNLPDLADIGSMQKLLRTHGVAIENGAVLGEMSFDAAAVADTTAPYDLVRRMRASVLVLAPLLARFGRARVSLPGGCAIGTRPIDLHLKALGRLGAEDRPRRRLCRGAGARRSDRRRFRIPDRVGRRDGERDNGREPRPRRDGSQETPRASRRSSTSGAA